MNDFLAGVRRILLLAATLALAAGCAADHPAADAPGMLAAKPLYRDPVYDGAADPTLIWNPQRGHRWMFYTNRRATATGLPGFSWVHGTRIGIAESADGGATWQYVGTADVELPPDLGGADATHWAPDVVRADDGSYHMFLTVVPGVFEDWQHPRVIVHLTSSDLRTWRHAEPVPLAGAKVIDPSLARLPDGSWRMWYNNELDHKYTYYADSPDLHHWTDKGLAVAQRGEGPKVFRWRGAWWMLIDTWKGLAVLRSNDALAWTQQPQRILETPGTGPQDGMNGGHADVVVSGDRAWVFYFLHPGRAGTGAKLDGPEQRRSLIQVAELIDDGGILRAERDRPTHIRLDPPAPAPVFHNPLVPQRADPQVELAPDGWYYFTATVPEYDRIELRRARSLDGLGAATPKVVWRKHASGAMGAHIWAPEIHRIDGKWYIYFTAAPADRIWDIRLYVLENAAANPLEGEWIERGQLRTGWESFALDATTFENAGRRYLAWAQRAPDGSKGTNIYIARMDTPLSIAGPAVLLSKPEYAWEKVKYDVNEGPAVLVKNGRVFLTYSASATDANYCMGMLTARADADLLDPAAWTKSPRPVFESSARNGQWGPGHNAFTTTPDGQYDILVYHARGYRDIAGDPLHDPNRATRAQVIHWRPDGTPDFGAPVADKNVPAPEK